MEQSRTCRPPHTPPPQSPGDPGGAGQDRISTVRPGQGPVARADVFGRGPGLDSGHRFRRSSLYLFLKVGMTVSASIPVAVLAITIFRGLSTAFGIRRTTILENNIVQTAGSAGESIAFGVGATMPALMLLGYELEWTRVMLVSVLGGLLGILMMIPLRRAFIVKQHGALPYPEGTACAKVLIVGEQGGSNARTVFPGFGFGFRLPDPDAGIQVLVGRVGRRSPASRATTRRSCRSSHRRSCWGSVTSSGRESRRSWLAAAS